MEERPDKSLKDLSLKEHPLRIRVKKIIIINKEAFTGTETQFQIISIYDWMRAIREYSCS